MTDKERAMPEMELTFMQRHINQLNDSLSNLEYVERRLSQMGKRAFNLEYKEDGRLPGIDENPSMNQMCQFTEERLDALVKAITIRVEAIEKFV